MERKEACKSMPILNFPLEVFQVILEQLRGNSLYLLRLTGDNTLCKRMHLQPNAAIELETDDHNFHRLASQLGSLSAFTRLSHLSIISEPCRPDDRTQHFTDWKVTWLPKTLRSLVISHPYSCLAFTHQGYKELEFESGEFGDASFQDKVQGRIRRMLLNALTIFKVHGAFTFFNLNDLLPDLEKLEIEDTLFQFVEESEKRSFSKVFLPTLPKSLTHLSHSFITAASLIQQESLSITSLVDHEARWEDFEQNRLLPLTELSFVGDMYDYRGASDDEDMAPKRALLLENLRYNLSGLHSLRTQFLPPPHFWPFLANLTSLHISTDRDHTSTEEILSKVKQHFPHVTRLTLAQPEADELSDLTPLPSSLTSFTLYGATMAELPDRFWSWMPAHLTSLSLPEISVSDTFWSMIPSNITRLSALTGIADHLLPTLPKTLRYLRLYSVICTGRLLPKDYSGPSDEVSVVEMTKGCLKIHYALDAPWVKL